MVDLLDDGDLLDLGPRKRSDDSDPRAFARHIQQQRQGRGLPGANKELEAWMADNGHLNATVRPEGACYLCGERQSRMTCRACDRPCCNADSWTMLGLCRVCAKEERIHTSDDARISGRNWLAE